MKTIVFRLFAVLFLTCFAACYEVNEEIVINENGSGTYVTKMDLSALIDMMKTMAGDDELAKQGLDRAIDTTILMKDMMDSANVTEQQKQVLKHGRMNLQMNLQDNIFRTNLDFPFRSYDDLQVLMAGAGSGGMGDVFKAVFNAGSKQVSDSAKDPPGLDALNTIFDVNIRNGMISRKVNRQKFDEIVAREEFAPMKEMSQSGVEIMYTTTFKLPRPVKKSDNAIVKLSNDKRTVTIRYNLLELFNAPDKFSYEIEY
jgi:hypothetical protein